jgi:hypothetical protein
MNGFSGGKVERQPSVSEFEYVSVSRLITSATVS